MFASKASTLRPNLVAAFRRPLSPLLPRSVGRRGYASLQERIAQSSNRPWQMAAVAVTIPGLMFLRGGRTAKPTESVRGHHTEAHAMPAGPPKQEPKAEPKVGSQMKATAQAKMEEGIEKTQNPGSASAA